MRPPRKHHYVPQFLLRKFLSSSGELWVYDTHESRFFSTGTTNAGMEKDLYAFQNEGEIKDYSSIEKLFCDNFETPAAPVIERFLAEEFVSGEESFAFIRFVAAQLSRTPTFFKRTKELLTPTLQEMSARIARYEPDFRQKVTGRLEAEGVSKEDIEGMFEEWSSSPNIEPSSAFILAVSLPAIETFTDCLCQMKWCFLSVPEGEPDLLLGDHPAILHKSSSEGRDTRTLGIANPDTEVLFPISKRVLARARWTGPVSYGKLCSGSAGLCNLITLSNAQRFVFGSNGSQELLNLALKHKGTGPKTHVHRVNVGNGLMQIFEFH